MKRFLVVISLATASATACFADLAAYQNTIANPTGNTPGPTYWWKFDGDLSQSGSGAGGVLTEGNGFGGSLGGFTNDYFGNGSDARYIGSSSNNLSTATDVISGGSSSLLGDPTAAGTGSLVVTFQTPGAATTGQRFVFGQGATTTGASNSFAFFLENSGAAAKGANLRAGNTTLDISSSNNLALSTWYYLAVTWKENRNSGELLWYFGPVGGVLTSGSMNINDNAVVGNNGAFTIGNASTAASQGFREPNNLGAIDELATYDYELSPASINSQFSAFVIPEPSTMLLCVSAIAGLCAIVRRRQPPMK